MDINILLFLKRPLAMHVFLDSNVLFKDYFFGNNTNKIILEYSRKGLINLYMAEIVKLELRKQFLDELEEKNRDLKKVIKDVTRLKIEKEISLLDIDEHMNKFDKFYRNLSSGYSAS